MDANLSKTWAADCKKKGVDDLRTAVDWSLSDLINVCLILFAGSSCKILLTLNRWRRIVLRSQLRLIVKHFVGSIWDERISDKYLHTINYFFFVVSHKICQEADAENVLRPTDSADYGYLGENLHRTQPRGHCKKCVSSEQSIQWFKIHTRSYCFNCRWYYVTARLDSMVKVLARMPK